MLCSDWQAAAPKANDNEKSHQRTVVTGADNLTTPEASTPRSGPRRTRTRGRRQYALSP